MKRFRILILTVVLVLLAMVATTAFAKGTSTYVRLTVINESQHPFSMTIYGGPSDLKSISVAAYSQGAWVLRRGTYSFTMYACGGSETGTLDMTKYQIIHVPVCGGNAGALGQKNHHIDASEYIKPIRVTLRNKTGEPIGVFLRTMEHHYFLNFEPGEIKRIIIFKSENDYVYSYVACGELVVKYWHPYVSVPHDLTCNK